MNSIRLKLSLLCSLFVSCFASHSEVKLPALFSDNMVLQQQTNASIWGWAETSETVAITPSWSGVTYFVSPELNGSWKTEISTPEYGGPYRIEIKGTNTIVLENILIGEVWLCSGQSNMEMPMKGFRGEPVQNSNYDILTSSNNNLRFISVPRKSTTAPQNDFEGSWQMANPSTVSDFSATAYYFGELLNEALGDIPIGLVEVSYGGSIAQAWMSEERLTKYEDTISKSDEDIREVSRTPTTLYKGMLKPVVGYSIRGCIWYQGESNAHEPNRYLELFPDMVNQWRDEWNLGSFPFYYVQIAPFNYDLFYDANDLPWYSNSAYLRDAQRKAQDLIPDSGMISLLDAGSMKTIHPIDKKTPGERLAFMALAKTYDLEGFGYATPEYDELNIEDSLVTITFRNLPNGITSYNKAVTAFEVAGEDQVFYPATCIVRRKSVQVYSDEVKNPVAVRYAFTNEGPAQIFSTEGLPVSSFRTDNWDQ